ncbi:MAG: 4-(cytidine 5'-diphospho)-2-C-methyl-D-erythritol kinase [Pseudomonadota bacterium]
MASDTIKAFAKVNLTLQVHGRRPDGYHVLSSLVVFADLADELAVVDPETHPPVAYRGPHAEGLGAADRASDLVTTARDLIGEIFPEWPRPHVVISKAIPQAAGLGGGSADAAAYLTLALKRAEALGAVGDPAGARSLLAKNAAKLGADVPVCLLREAAFVAGIGDRLQRVPIRQPRHAVLVRPDVAVPDAKTRAVFQALNARALESDETPDAPPNNDLEGAMAKAGNDLQAPAIQLMPEITAALDALEASPGARYARLSGAGPTTFALFETSAAALSAAQKIAGAHPTWWVQAVRLGSPTMFEDQAAQ